MQKGFGYEIKAKGCNSVNTLTIMEVDMSDALPGALDIGTNSILLLVCRPGKNGELMEFHEDLRMPRLGEKTGSERRLHPTAVERALIATEELLRNLPRGENIRLAAAATSAVRDAENRSLFLNGFRHRFGGVPWLLTGEEEALTVFQGVASDMCRRGSFLVNVDVGGGSTEMGVGDEEGGCRWSRSFDVGCVRFGERFDLYDVSEPKAREEARCEVRRLLEPGLEEIRQITGNKPVRMVAGAGTATSYAAWRQGLTTYQRQLVHGWQDSEAAVSEAAEELAAVPLAMRQEIPCINPGRAAVLPAGLLILSEVLRGLQAEDFTVTTRGLRYGLALRLSKGEIPTVLEIGSDT